MGYRAINRKNTRMINDCITPLWQTLKMCQKSQTDIDFFLTSFTPTPFIIYGKCYTCYYRPKKELDFTLCFRIFFEFLGLRRICLIGCGIGRWCLDWGHKTRCAFNWSFKWWRRSLFIGGLETGALLGIRRWWCLFAFGSSSFKRGREVWRFLTPALYSFGCISCGAWHMTWLLGLYGDEHTSISMGSRNSGRLGSISGRAGQAEIIIDIKIAFSHQMDRTTWVPGCLEICVQMAAGCLGTCSSRALKIHVY